MIQLRAVTIMCLATLIGQKPYAFARQAEPGGAQNQSQQTLTAGQLDSLVAPVALYPDPILSQVLVASTYPLEIVEATRWLAQNSNLRGRELADAAAQQPWDASVQALVILPDVLRRLDDNVSWTADLGNAFIAQEQGVMDAVQRMRRRAMDAGALQSTKEQTVSTANENNRTYIVIQPANPQVVYVPVYNPVAVWGPPSVIYPFPRMYYPPSTGAIVGASALSFGTGMAVGAMWGGGWGGWGWGFGWGRGNVVINNNFITRNRFTRANVGSGNRWISNPERRRRAGVNRPNRPGQGANRPNRPGQGNLGQGANRPNRPGQGANRPNRPGQGNLAQGGNRPNRPGQGSASRISQGNSNRGGNSGNRNIARGGGGQRGSASRATGRGVRAGGGGGHRGSANRAMGGGARRGGGGGGHRGSANRAMGGGARRGGGGGGPRGSAGRARGGARGGGRRR